MAGVMKPKETAQALHPKHLAVERTRKARVRSEDNPEKLYIRPQHHQGVSFSKCFGPHGSHRASLWLGKIIKVFLQFPDQEKLSRHPLGSPGQVPDEALSGLLVQTSPLSRNCRRNWKAPGWQRSHPPCSLLVLLLQRPKPTRTGSAFNMIEVYLSLVSQFKVDSPLSFPPQSGSGTRALSDAWSHA